MVTTNVQEQLQEIQDRKNQSRQVQSERIQALKAQIAQAERESSQEIEKKAKKEDFKGDKRFRAIDTALKRSGDSQDALIEVMHKAQETFGYLDDDVLEYITRRLKLPLSVVYGVATFYHLFSLKPQGEHNCVVCLGTACYVKGGGKIIEMIEQHFGVKSGETTADGKLSLLTARCIGACGIAPAVTLDGDVKGKQIGESVLAAIAELITTGKAQEIKDKVEALTSV
jgi:bidirectional [NiFe] hydrogenase diaphorase subunit